MANKGLFKLLKIDQLIEHFSGYIEDKIALVKLEAREEIAHVITKATISLVLFSLFTLALLFMSIVLALYVGELLDKYYIGFGIVGLIYVLLFLILFLLRNHNALNRIVGKKINGWSEKK